jgi:hypothetical protein
VSNLSEDQINAILRGMLNTDGYSLHGKYDGYSQVNKLRTEDFQLLNFLTGKMGNISTYKKKGEIDPDTGRLKINIKGRDVTASQYVHNMYVQKSNLTEARKCRMNYDRLDGKHEVWCPRTNNNTWVARRNGFITITGNTAKGLGTTTTALASMSPTQQLQYVKRYFQPYASKIVRYSDLYRAVFFPISLGKDKDFAFSDGRGAEFIANANPAIKRYSTEPFDKLTSSDTIITNEVFERYALAKIPASLRDSFRDKSMDSIGKMAGRNKWAIVSSIALVLVVGYIVMFKIVNK